MYQARPYPICRRHTSNTNLCRCHAFLSWTKTYAKGRPVPLWLQASYIQSRHEAGAWLGQGAHLWSRGCYSLCNFGEPARGCCNLWRAGSRSCCCWLLYIFSWSVAIKNEGDADLPTLARRHILASLFGLKMARHECKAPALPSHQGAGLSPVSL